MMKLKAIAVFWKILACFITHTNFRNFIHDIVQKYTTLSKSQLRNYEKRSIKVKKAELDLDFSSNCSLFNVK